MTLLPLLSGFWQDDLEQEATKILMADRALQGNAINAKKDWLNDDQLRMRREREVQSEHPIDRLIYAGIYRRAYNPLAGTRPTSRHRLSLPQDPWRQDAYEFTGWAESFTPSWSRPDRMVEGGEHYTWEIMHPHRVSSCRGEKKSV